MHAAADGFGARLQSLLLVTAVISTLSGTPAALAAPGSVTSLPLQIMEYAETQCPEELAQGRAGGAHARGPAGSAAQGPRSRGAAGHDAGDAAAGVGHTDCRCRADGAGAEAGHPHRAEDTPRPK